MAIQTISSGDFEAVQTELKERLGPVQPPRIVNTEAAVGLSVGTRFVYRGKVYIADPVPFHVGAQLQKDRLALQQFSELSAESEVAIDDYISQTRASVTLIWKYMLPDSPIGAVLKKLRLLRNPFLDATDGEVIALINFFLPLRMLSSFRTLSH